MNYIVMDLEWNQSSTGKEPEVARMPFEIIEIGAIKLNDNFDMVGEFSQLIKPAVYPRLYHITRKLIHLQMEELERGGKFTDVAGEYRLWCGDDHILCTWGPADITEFQRNLSFYGMPLIKDGPVEYLDVQKLFALSFAKDKNSRLSLENAVDILEIEKDIPFHRAFSDAYYTAKVLARISKEYPEVLKFVSYDVTFAPRIREEEIFKDFGNYTKHITRAFPTKEAALGDKDVQTITCDMCHRPIKRKMGWFALNGKAYMAAGICEKHGMVKNKIRLQKLADETICVVKITKPIKDDGLLILQEKSARAEELRRKRREAERARNHKA